MSEEHEPQIREYDWTIGPRWRWDCSCGQGGGGYTTGESAEAAFEAHLRYEAMWVRHRSKLAAGE